MIHYVDTQGRLWACERAITCVTDSIVRKPPKDVAKVRALHVDRGVTTDELRKTRRALEREDAFRRLLSSDDQETTLGLVRASAARFDAAGWTLPPLPAPAQPNDYGKLLAVVRNRRAKALGANARASLEEMLGARYADAALLDAQVRRMSGVFAVREIQAAQLLELY